MELKQELEAALNILFHLHGVCAQLFICVLLSATLWTVVYQAPPSMGFFRQGYWSGLLFPPPGDLPNPGIEPRSPTLQADALTSAPPENGSECEVE